MFTLDAVVPWGRSFEEYCRMFALTADDLRQRIVGCGDGPAGFNAVAARRGHRVVSCDPLYRFSGTEIAARIAATSPQVLEQTRRNANEFVWGHGIRDVAELALVRMTAMQTFLADYEDGKVAGRYVDASLPSLPFADASFDLALCSHFLFLYELQLGEDVHRAALREMARVAAEVRVFPLLTLSGTPSACVERCQEDLIASGCEVSIERVPYEFQRGGNQMLRVSRAAAGLSSRWLEIPLSDYEGHMAAIGQSALLRRCFGDVYQRYRPRRVAVLGCTSGADLMAIDPSITDTSVGVDINPAYIEEARSRLVDALPRPTLIAGDVLRVHLPRDRFDLIHAALLLEYVEPSAVLARIHGWLAPGGVCSVVLQQPSPEGGPVSRTEYESLGRLSGEMRLSSAADVLTAADLAGLRLLEHRSMTAGNKAFTELVLRR